MHRSLVICLLLLAAWLPAQGSVAKITLKDGRTVEGEVVRDSEKEIVIRVHGQERLIPISFIQTLEMAAGRRPFELPSAPPPAAPGPSSAPPNAEASESKPVNHDAVEQLFHEERAPTRWMTRYLWFVPDTARAQVSVGLVVWLLLGFLIHTTVRVVGGVDDARLTRGLLSAVLIIAVAGVQLALTPLSSIEFGGFILLDVLLWMLLAYVTYGINPGRAALTLLALVFLTLAIVLTLQVAAFFLEQVNVPEPNGG